MKASNFLEDAILNYFFRKQSISQPQELYIALYKNNPTDNDTGTEVSGGGYVRQKITFGTSSQQAERAQITNAQKIEFATAENTWGEIAYFGIRDAKQSGNLLVYGTFNKPVQIEEGNKFIIEAGNLTVSVG